MTLVAAAAGCSSNATCGCWRRRASGQNGRLQLPSNVAPLKLFGQEINGSTFAIARMNSFLHDMEAEIMLGDTMHRPAFTVGDGSLRQFDLVIANPMWNQKFPASNYENDPYERFRFGTPPSSSADWGWVQHMAAGLGPAVVWRWCWIQVP